MSDQATVGLWFLSWDHHQVHFQLVYCLEVNGYLTRLQMAIQVYLLKSDTNGLDRSHSACGKLSLDYCP